MGEDLFERMNVFYHGMEQLWISVYASLDHRVFELESGYQPRHSYFNAQRERITDDFPLPYIVLKGFCEFQVEPTCLSCFTEVRVKDVSVLNAPAFRDVPFDVWGEDDSMNCSTAPARIASLCLKGLPTRRSSGWWFTFTSPGNRTEMISIGLRSSCESGASSFAEIDFFTNSEGRSLSFRARPRGNWKPV